MSAPGTRARSSALASSRQSCTLHAPRWLTQWHALTEDRRGRERDARSADMKRINPRYTWREWLVSQAYEAAEEGDYAMVGELQELFNDSYTEQPGALAEQSDRKRPPQFEGLGGVSHYSCSS